MAALSSGTQQVAAARHLAVHARAAHLLERDLLADDLLGHARRAQVHRGVVLLTMNTTSQNAGMYAPPAARRTEQAADLGDAAGRLDLVVEDLPGAAAAGEQLHLVGDPRPGRVHQVHDGDRPLPGQLDDPDDLLDGARAPRAGLHGGVVRHHRHRAPVDRAHAGDHAVGGQVAGQGVGQQAVLGERRRRRPAAGEAARERTACPARRASRGTSGRRRPGRGPRPRPRRRPRVVPGRTRGRV